MTTPTPNPTVAPIVEQVMEQASYYAWVREENYLSSEVQQEKDELRRMVEALAVDAERYRWLRDNTRAYSLDMGGQHKYDPSKAFRKLAGPTLDQAIDSARTKGS